jgi:hypothetical protein
MASSAISSTKGEVLPAFSVSKLPRLCLELVRRRVDDRGWKEESILMITRFQPLLCAALLSAFLGPIVHGQIIVDDFNDGNDTGWTRSNPLAPFGGTASYSFPNGNSYRIKPDPSPNPAAFGSGRAGSFRPEVYTNSFHLSVDLVAWDNSILQDVGILAFVNTPGAGTLNCYAFSYDVDSGTMFLSRLDNEIASTLGSFDLALDPTHHYRLIFQGFLGDIRGDLFDLASPEFPLGSIFTRDTTYSSGPCGIFVAHGVGDGGGIADATFDNYRSSPDTDVDADGMGDQWELDHFGELFFFEDEDNDGDGQANLEEFIGGSDPTDPASLSGLAEASVTAGEMTLSFALVAGRTYSLETSTDLETWIPQPAAVFADIGAKGSLTLPTGGQSVLFGRVVTTVN